AVACRSLALASRFWRFTARKGGCGPADPSPATRQAYRNFRRIPSSLATADTLSPANIRSTACRLNSGLYFHHFRPLVCFTFAPFDESVPKPHCLNFRPQARSVSRQPAMSPSAFYGLVCQVCATGSERRRKGVFCETKWPVMYGVLQKLQWSSARRRLLLLWWTGWHAAEYPRKVLRDPGAGRLDGRSDVWFRARGIFLISGTYQGIGVA